jgi:hypothetical protein
MFARNDIRSGMRIIVLAAALLLSSCKDERPPAPTAKQAAELNQAEDMLNAMAQNEEGPEANASGPSHRSR